MASANFGYEDRCAIPWREHVDSIEDALSYYIGPKEANVPVELHAYAQGGHAFGLRPSKLPVSGWPQLVEKWLRTIGMLSE